MLSDSYTYLQTMQPSLTTQLAATREQQMILRPALDKQQRAGDLLSKSHENMAAMLATQLEDATQALAHKHEG
jgi:hypothetical protein